MKRAGHNSILRIMKASAGKVSAVPIRLRMIAMIDVIFLLLTFFVLTARFRAPEDYLPLKLPQNRSAAVSRPVVPLLISLEKQTAGYSLGIGGAETAEVDAENTDTGLAEFALTLKSVIESQSRAAGDPVEIRCADEVDYKFLVRVYNLLHTMGIRDITFIMD